MKIKNVISSKGNVFDGPKIITPKIFNDDRGNFHESWNLKQFNKAIGYEVDFVQDNESCSSIGVLRGMHYQIHPNAQSKLVRVNRGSIFDVIIDVREKSETFAEWAGINLDDKKKEQLWIPQGFAHGFLALKRRVIVSYKVDKYWSNICERTLLWNDCNINIEWPFQKYKLEKPLISIKDGKGTYLKDLVSRGEIFR